MTWFARDGDPRRAGFVTAGLSALYIAFLFIPASLELRVVLLLPIAAL